MLKKTHNIEKKENADLLTERGLERRIKRQLSKKECAFFAITVPGFESVLQCEIEKIPDVKNVQCVAGGVEFLGPFDTVYHANLQLRTANRVLLRIDSFTARSYPELYNKSKKIDWEIYCGFAKEISFSVSSTTSRLHHTDNIETAVFDSVSEVMTKLGTTISKVKTSPIKFHIRFLDDTCTISIDTSGELLYRRGYRTEVAHAPIRETTASALLIAAECSKYKIIADPMCGSGTFMLEACSIIKNSSPGLNRSFAFEIWPSFMQSKWERLKTDCKKRVIDNVSCEFVGSDISNDAITAASINSTNSSFSSSLLFTKQDFFEFNVNVKYGKSGLIISNLPYGKRVGESTELHAFYRKLGDHLRVNSKGWHYGFVSADRKFPSISKLAVKKEIRFVNGGIPVTFYMGKI